MHMKTIAMMLLGMAGSLPMSGAMLPADTGSAAASQAASTALPVRVIHELDTTWTFSYNDLQLFSREMHRIDIVYPSKDIDGADVELSGQVVIPTEVYNGEQPCDGILLYNHFSTMAKTDVPTRGYAQGIDYVMTTPLKPNWIVVTSDFLGFGITEDRDQVYCFNDINGQASIDCLLAARQLLSQRGISQGRFTINAGYSSGGFDAIATQRVRDLRYRDQVVFDKTLVGGAPFDIMAAINEFINWKDENIDVTFVPMTLGFLNKYANLGFTYDQLFKEPVASHFEEWYMCGDYDNDYVRAQLKGLKVSDVIQDDLLSRQGEIYSAIRKAAEENSLANGWTPDSTQHYFVFHAMRDSVVPTNSGRAFIEFLNRFDYDGKRCDGFKKTIVPERTRLQTNFMIPTGKHTMVGGIAFYLTLSSALTAQPLLYYDDELNTHYADLIEPATLMGIVHLLEEKGIDVRALYKRLTSSGEEGGESGGGLDFFSMLAQLEETLNNFGTDTTEVLQMLSDSGIELTDLLQLFTYLNSEPAAARTLSAKDIREASEACIVGYYERRLTNWLKENNVNIFE